MLRRAPWVAAVAAVLLTPLAGAEPTPEPAAPAYSLGPAPRDPSGRFQNFRPIARAGPSVTLPFFARRILGRLRRPPEGLPEREPEARRRLEDVLRAESASVTWINHASILVRMDGVTVLTDPTFSGSAGPGGVLGARRLVEPGLALADLPEIDLVVVSHNHYDSFELGALRDLGVRYPGARFLVPLGDGERLRAEGVERVHELDWGDSLRVDGVVVHCLPAQHWSQRGLSDARRSLWASWAVVGPTRRLLFVGDTGYFPVFTLVGTAFGPFDLAAIPIGAYEPAAMMRDVHLNPEEAVRLARDARARRWLGIHWGTFDLTDEPVDEPPRRFHAAAQAAGLEEHAWVFRLGETRPF